MSLYLFLGCSKNESAEILTFNLKSYTTISEVRKLLISKQAQYSIENSSLEKSDKRPKFNITTIKTKIFTRDGFKGETQFIFFNNKLMEIQFLPQKDKEYQIFFIREEHMNKNIKKNNNIQVEIVKDYTGKYYIIWTDVRLDKKMKAWLRKYS